MAPVFKAVVVMARALYLSEPVRWLISGPDDTHRRPDLQLRESKQNQFRNFRSFKQKRVWDLIAVTPIRKGSACA